MVVGKLGAWSIFVALISAVSAQVGDVREPASSPSQMRMAEAPSTSDEADVDSVLVEAADLECPPSSGAVRTVSAEAPCRNVEAESDRL